MWWNNLNQISRWLDSNLDEIFSRENQWIIEPNNLKLSKKIYTDKNITWPTKLELKNLIVDARENPLDINKWKLLVDMGNKYL